MGLFSSKCSSRARLDGKIAIITGSNTGIGKITAQDFYERGALVLMACRNEGKALKSMEDIKNACKNKSNLGQLETINLDLSSLESVRFCAQEILKRKAKVDLLINNAGIMACPLTRTPEGFEMQFVSNYLGHFLFTLLLLPKMSSAGCRIVNVSSVAHEMGKIDFDDLNFETRPYKALQAYQQSKLCNVLFTKELAIKLQRNHIQNINVYCLHPGIIQTELGRHFSTTYNRFFVWIWRFIFKRFMKTPWQGAQTTIYCAVDEACSQESGFYYSNCARKAPSKDACNEDISKRLWEESLKLVGLHDYDYLK